MSVEPHDETAIQSGHTIIRRINPDQHLVEDDQGCKRVSSKAFTPSSGVNGGMSVDIEAKILEDGRDPKEHVTNSMFPCSVCFQAKDIRDLQLWIGYEPIPDNPYHGEVWRPNRRRFTLGQKRGLHKACKWYVALEDVKLGRGKP